VPFAMGAAISPLLLARFGTVGESKMGFALFAGIAMSITALPVLARIVQERRGTARAVDSATAAIALVCAAANDLLAWSLLAVTLTLIHGGGVGATVVRLVVLAAYVGLMLLVVRPVAARGATVWPATWAWVAGMVAMAFLSARITEALGVHAFFGAFLAGVCVPRMHSLENGLERVLQPLVRLGLPVFFAMTGLKMQREMLSGGGLGWLAVVLVIAVVGKIGGGALAARASGMAWRKAGVIGVLLNTRGLVELVVLNIGYKEGILSPLLFTLFVLMAIVTTAMTVPLLNLLER
jgi:Kef-type K+ transport system membrane component KefB